MKTYINALKNISIVKTLLLTFVLMALSPCVWAEENIVSINTSLRNGTTLNEAELTFNYTIKYKSESGQLKYKLPERLVVNNKAPVRYGNTYRATLQEGENKIQVSYQDGADYYFETFVYHLDTQPPYINAKGLYDHMMVNKSHIKFSINVGDLQSIPEALDVHVYLNDTELKENYGFYQGLLKQSPLLGKKQKIATNDRQPTENVIKVTAKDALGNENIRVYHVIFVGETTNFSQLRYLIEKVPGLLPFTPRYDNIGHYSEAGVALDDSNVTVLGTYGGYVLLGHDQPIFNGPGDDILVNGHWSDQGFPLTSIWVMKDWNNNQLPDDEWYYIDDGIDAKREIINAKAAYSLQNVGRYKDNDGNNKLVTSLIPVRSPYSTSYYENAKALNKFDYSSSYYSVYGNLNVFHSQPIKKLTYNAKGYDLDKAYTLDGEAVALETVDFVKVYTNTLDLQEDVGSVMPAVNYVLALHDTGTSFACENEAFKIIDPLPSYDKGDVLSVDVIDPRVAIQYKQVRPQVNEDYVFVFPDEDDSNHLPFKVEADGLEVFYPHNRGTLESIPLEITTVEEVNALTWSALMTQRYYVKSQLAYGHLTSVEEGQLELLDKAIEKQWQMRLKDSFSQLNNNYDRLLSLKSQLDYLEDSTYFNWPEADRLALETLLFKMIDYSPGSFKLADTRGQTITITPMDNISSILSKEELERQIRPEYLIAERPLPAGKTGIASFDLSLFKSDKKMTRLYRPVGYQMTLNEPWTENLHLYYVTSSGDVELPVEVLEGHTIKFMTNELGWFYVGRE